MDKLVKKGFNKDNIISFGNMFLIGNGHIGYRGTLEEYSKGEMVGLNVVGAYDKYLDKWRESINMPNPFYVKCFVDDEEVSCLTKECNHKQVLDISKAIHYRVSEFRDITIKSERFIPFKETDEIYFQYRIINKSKKCIKVRVGLDLDIYEINGPHFKNKNVEQTFHGVKFTGITNEDKIHTEDVRYILPYYEYHDGYYWFEVCDKEIVIYCKAVVDSDNYTFSKVDYRIELASHLGIMKRKWDISRIEVMGSKDCQFSVDYSIYHLLILGNEYHNTSIPARGVSGSVYKGAIFWDTEIFMVPFFCMTNPNVTKRLLEYRIKTLSGALSKGLEYHSPGAFYAWESQEDGLEACSKYNVTDPITNEPIRTYFNEKQIHISFDIAYAYHTYMKVTNDYSLLDIGGLDVLKEIARFMMSYATYRDGKYHLDDVIGPDEYHERVNDNAFTSYMAYYTSLDTLELLKKYDDEESFVKELEDFLDNFYLPIIDENLIIEQFSGYNDLEDTTVDIVRSRLRHPKDYWGGENGVATHTKIIKQADVITLLVLLGDKFSDEVKKANFDYYYKYTEHGSSLSSSMYSVIAGKIGYLDICYEMMRKSSDIDLGTNQKMFAGGIYIGGTHPASNAGTYLSIVYGMAGLKFSDDGFSLEPHLPKNIKGLEFKIMYRNKVYDIIIDRNNKYIINGEI